MKRLDLSGTENVWINHDDEGIFEVEFWSGTECVRYPAEFIPAIAKFLSEIADLWLMEFEDPDVWTDDLKWGKE